ncbi:WD40 repeat domain-containing serine/threonine protein kinase [Streptomyces sp. NRRL F-5650]|uniref:WD40 repeat domain-containing serine/threonine protein kinase n=1 Tax=Streptomyces sp. NRRL F-5650 TaxID=1463868 RepID=UPI0004C4A29B|nr:serine/threonine-protein kinase [Streptomyces sp. NRRL F-5650]
MAVKVVSEELARDPEFRRALAREVAGALRVNGFYVAQVVDADADPGQAGEPPWLATAYIAGPSLQAAVDAHGPLPGEAVRVLGAGLAEGLAAVHGAGLSHGDLKPGNVILGEDGPRLTDFAVSRALDAAHPSMTVGGAFGWYIAPERIRGGEPAGPASAYASDVFSLAGVLVFAATGRPPFGGEAGSGALHRIVHEEADLTGVPAGLRGVVRDCLAKDPGARPGLPEVLRRLATPSDRPAGSAGAGASAGAGGAGAGGADGRPWLPPAVAAMAGELREQTQKLPRGAKPMGRRGLLAAVGAVAVAAVAVPVVMSLGGEDEDEGDGKGAGGDLGSKGAGDAALPAAVKLLPKKKVSLGKVDDRAPFGFSPDGKSLAVGGVERLRLFDVASGRETDELKVEKATGELHGVAYSPRGGVLAAGYHWNTYLGIADGGSYTPDVGGVTVWDPASGKTVAELKTEPTGGGGLMPLWGIALSPDGRSVAAACNGEGAIGKVPVWDVRSGKPVEELVVGAGRGTSTSWVTSVAYSPDGKTLVAGYRRDLEGGLVFWDVSSGQYRELATERVRSKETFGVSGLAFSPDGRTLACAYGGVEVWDVASRKWLASPGETSDGYSAVAFSPDGKLIAAVAHGRVTLWDADSHKEAVSAKGGDEGTGNIAFSPDGKTLAATFEDAKKQTVVQLWDVQ